MNRKIKVFILFRIFLLISLVVSFFPLATIPLQAAGNNYYVRKDGNDSNAGTTDSAAGAWLTIQKAASTMVAGDTVTVHLGTYFEQIVPANSGTALNYITYKIATGESVIISGTGTDLGADLNTTWANGLVKIWNKSYLKFDGFEIYNADTDGADGITVYAAEGNSCNYIDLRNLTIHKTGRSGIDFVTSGVDSTGRNNNMTVYNCDIYDTNWAADQEGISMSHVVNAEVSNCKVYEMYLQGGGYRQQGIDAKDASSGILIHNNEVYTASVGIYIDSSTSATVYQNEVHDITNGGACIMLAHETDATLTQTTSIYNNLLYDSPCLFKVQAPTLVDDGTYKQTFTFINNTLYGWTEGDNGASALYGVAAGYTGCVFRNNITQATNAGSAINLLYCANVPTGLTINYNLWYNPGGLAPATYVGTNYVDANPDMTNPAGGDFTIDSTSPAFNVGTSTSAPTTDYIGTSRPQGVAFDIGAYESIVTPPTPTPTLTPPSVLSAAATNNSFTTETLNGNLTNLGTATSVVVSFDYGLTTSYGYNAVATESPMGSTGTFHADITGLGSGQTYHFRAKAVGDGTVYGADLTFTTKSVPAVTTGEASSILANSATLNASLTSLGSATSITVSFEYGATTAYGSTAVADESPMSGTGSFHADIVGLNAGQVYHFRAKAVGDATVYGSDNTFGTPTPVPDPEPPSVTTGSYALLTTTTITLQGSLTAMGSATSVIVGFEYGTTISYGYSAVATESPLALINTFSAPISGLRPNTLYHYRATASGDGTVKGSDGTFTTQAEPTPPAPPTPTPSTTFSTGVSGVNGLIPMFLIIAVIFGIILAITRGQNLIISLVAAIVVFYMVFAFLPGITQTINSIFGW